MDQEGVDAPDEALLAAYRAGILKSAAALYDRHSGDLYSYAFWRLRDTNESEDVVQEAFFRLFTHRSAKSPSSVRAFLYTVARNLVLDVLRKASVRQKHLSFVFHTTSEGLAPGDSPPAELQGAALAELDRLPDDQRDAVVLKIFGKLTFPQIAEVQNVPEGTASSRYRNAIEKLAERLNVERGNR